MAKVPRRSSNNIYKKGKLSKNARFSPRRIKWTPIIVIACILATFIFAMILGNFLGKKAQNLQNTTPPATDNSGITFPTPQKVDPKKELNAFFVDMSGEIPQDSLSPKTSTARERGNALFFEIKDDENKIIYNSDKTNELGFTHNEELTLARLKNHLEYYNDFAVGYFKSDFSAKLDSEKVLKLQTSEILLIKEATDLVFGQIIIDFSSEITKDDLISYQAYLLNLKLTCPTVPIGIKLSQSFLSSPDNAGIIAALLDTADFFALDLGSQDADSINDTLKDLIYFTERYNCLMMLDDSPNDDEIRLSQKIDALADKNIKNYIVK